MQRDRSFKEERGAQERRNPVFENAFSGQLLKGCGHQPADWDVLGAPCFCKAVIDLKHSTY
jgi:hypothetical protein